MERFESSSSKKLVIAGKSTFSSLLAPESSILTSVVRIIPRRTSFDIAIPSLISTDFANFPKLQSTKLFISSRVTIRSFDSKP